MTSTAILSIVLVIVSVYAAISVALSVPKFVMARRLRDQARADRVRSSFARARTSLIDVALTGDLDSRSETFRMMYFLTTAAMRHQDQYNQMWRGTVKAVSAARRRTSVLQDESRHWSPAAAQAVLKVGTALECLIVEHSTAHRFIRWLVMRDNPGHPAPLFAAISPSPAPVVEFKDEVRSMAEHRLAVA